MTTNRPLRVFLCHSSADKPAVRELYQKLRAEPWIQPWLDEEELFPGMDWNLEIEKAIEATDVILVCLSNSSITKEGYVQREIRIALDYADYKPEGTLFIIPVRLEECTPPKRLARWQYADYFVGQRERGIQRIFASLSRTMGDASKGITKDNSLRNPEIPTFERPPLSNTIIGSSVNIEKKETIEDNKKPESKVSGTFNKKVSLKRIVATLGHLYSKTTISNGMEFMLVPSGKFMMGSNKVDSLDSPQHIVDIPYNYAMARYATTQQLYSDYLRSQRLKVKFSLGGGMGNHPAIVDSFSEAAMYCEWLNNKYQKELPAGYMFRMPNEAEWEKAARGTDGRRFPWGNEFNARKCHMIFEFREHSTIAVDSHSPEGDSPYGCANMLGNVWEWTWSYKLKYPYKLIYQGANKSIIHMKRGGLGSNLENPIECSTRSKPSFRSYLDTIFYKDIGFRVCIAPPLSE